MRKKLLFFLMLISLSVFNSYGQVITPFKVRKTVTQKGGIIYLSNTSSKAVPDNVAQNEMPPSGTGYDNSFKNGYVDIDADASTFMSSSDKLNLPICSEVTWAGLYWGADCSSGDENFATRNLVKLKVNNGSYINLTADYLKDNTTGYRTYHCFKDITSIMQANGLNDNYTVANVATDIGSTNLFGGWTIVVIYKNNLQNMRNLTVFDGLANVSAGTYSTVDIPISGFQTPLSGPVTFELGLVVYDGDRSLTGDQLLFKGGSTFVGLSDALHKSTDMFNSTLANNGVLTPFRNPSYNNTLGYDANIFVPDNTAKNYIGNNAISATIRQTTGGETYLTQVVTSAIDVYEPDLRSAVRVKNLTHPGSAVANPDDILEYTVTGLNIGSDPSINTFLTDTIEGNGEYVKGSLQIITGPNTGSKSDAAGDDQGEYIEASKTIKVRIGTGANGFTGGKVINSPSGADSTRFSFQVKATSDCVYLSCDNIIDNRAFIFGTGEVSGNTYGNASNPEIFNASGCPAAGTTKTPIIMSGCSAPSATSNSPICAGGNLNLTATYSPAALYTWTGPNGFVSTLREPTISGVTVANSGTYTLDLHVPGAKCHKIFTINAPISIANAGPDQTGSATCGKTTVTLQGNNPAGTTGMWTVNSGTGGSFANSSNPGTTFTGTPGTTYSLRWTLTTAGCSSTFDDVTISLSKNGSAVLSAISANCDNKLNVAVTNGASPFTLNIDNSVGIVNNYISGTNIPVYPVATTSYNLLSVTDANGCPASISGSPATIVVNNSMGTGTITANTTPTQDVIATTSVGPVAAGAGANSGSGGTNWTTPENITDADNTKYATVSSSSNYLEASNFGFTIPAGATIKGIIVEVQRKASRSTSSNNIYDNAIEVKGGTGTSSNRKSSTRWSTTETKQTYGSSTDLWNMTWTPAQVNAATFGARVKVSKSGSCTASVNAIRITVYYSISSKAYCDNLSSVSYTVSGYTNVTNYVWTPPSGASIVSGQGTTTAIFDLNGAGQSGNYSVVVTPYNACGAGTPATLSVPITDCANGSQAIIGNIFWDINGSVAPQKVDGTGIGIVNGTQLYVTAVKTNPTPAAFFKTVAVNSNGIYKIDNVVSGSTYQLVLSTTNYASGTTPAASLPSGCTNNGEVNNDLENTITGNDGTIDGKITVGPISGSNNDIRVNFGIKIPTKPVAGNDAGTTDEDTPVTINAVANDNDIDGTVNPSTITIVSSANGTWVPDVTGKVTYTPSLNFFGTATATYTVKDNDGLASDPATINVTVSPVNDPPAAIDNTVSTNENVTYTFEVSDFTYSDPEGDVPSSFTIATLPAKGTLKLTGSAVFTGQVIPASQIAGLTFTPAANESGSSYTTFSFRANDSNAGIVSGTMTINVVHVNQPPVAYDDNISTDQESTVIFNILSNDTNKDGTINAASADLDPVTAGRQVSLSIPGQGTFSLDNSGNLTFIPAAGYYGTTTPFYYTVANSLGLVSNQATITVFVKPLGAPVANPDAASTDENKAVTFNITSNDTDPDGINVARVDLDPLTSGIQQSYYVDGKGMFLVDLLGNVTFQPDWNFYGVVSINYTVKDNNNLVSNITTITVTVIQVNAAPFAVDDAIETNEDSPVSFNIVSNDYDIDGTIDATTVDLDPNTAGTQTTFTVAGEGSYSVNAAGLLTFTPALNFCGTTSPVYYTVKDNQGLSSDVTLPAQVTINVKCVNDAPVLTADTKLVTATTLASASATFNILANDTDVDDAIDPASVDLDPSKDGRQVIFTVSGEGTYTIDDAGNLTFTYSLTTPVKQLTPISYSAKDVVGLLSNISTVTVTVLPSDLPIAVNDAFSTLEDTPGSFNVIDNDTDNEGTNPGIDGSTVTFTSPVSTTGGTWSIDAVNLDGTVIFTPAANFSGTSSITYTVKDLDGNTSNTATVTVTVIPVNDAPSFTKGADQTVCENSDIQVIYGWATAMSAGPANESGQTLSFVVSNDNNALFVYQPSVDPSGNLYFQPAPGKFGSSLVSVNIKDDGGTANGGVDASAIKTFTITVTGAPNAPVASATQSFCNLALISDLVASAPGSTIKWYSTPTGGTELSYGTALVNGTKYYAEAFNAGTGCSSIYRTEVTVAIYDTPTTATITSATLNYCGTKTSGSLGGNTATSGAGLWSIVSGGTGTFSASTSGSSTFTADNYGTYTLRWTISNGTCTPTTADVTVNFYDTPSTATVSSGTLNYCGTMVSGSLGGNTPASGAGLWSIVSGGTGTFSASTSGSSTFTADNYGTYTLRWTISNGTCTPTTADVTVNFYATPTTASVTVGTLDYCGTMVSGSLGGNTPTSGAGLWSIVSGGTGTFTASTSGSSTFTADNYGTYTLRWTISNGTCTPTTADVTVNFYDTPSTASVSSGTLNYCGTMVSGSLGGSTPTSGAGLWSIVSGGTGTFSASTSGSSTFTADNYGTYTLRWTISNGTCTPTTADVTVNFYDTPSTASVSSGTLNYCGTMVSGSLGGNTPTSGAGLWSIISGGTGTFSASTSGSSTFTADNYGTYTLRWTISNGTCTPTTADVTVNFYATPSTATVSSGTLNYCGTMVSGSLDGNTPTSGAGLWSIVSGGTGTFSASTSGSSTFTADNYGTYTLRWTISNGTCTPTTADVTVNFYDTPSTASVSSGTLNYCGTMVSGSLGGNTPTSGAGLWSIVSGGTGTFSASTSGSSIFTADNYGTYTLRWTISNGTCTPTTADVTVNFYATPSTATVSSGTLNYCGTMVSGSLGGNTPTSGAGLWSIVSGGTGTFSASTSGSSTFTADNYGTYTLRWTISNGTCTPTTADVTVNLNDNPVAPTGNALQSFCNGNSPVVSDISVTGNNITWYDAATGGNIVSPTTALVDGKTYYATQNNGSCESVATLAVTVKILACIGPKIDDKTLSLDENTANGTEVWDVNDANTGADKDPDNNVLTYTIISGDNGAFEIDPATGKIKVKDATKLDYETTRVFILTVHASNGTTSDDAIITITLNNLNDNIPVAIADSYQVSEGGTLTVTAANGVLNNDTDADGNNLTAIKLTSPLHGTITFNSDGSFTYTHDGSETTSDSFTYKVNDGTSDGNTVTVTITINPVNDAPVAINDNASVDEGGILNGTSLLSNDTDIEGNTLTIITTPVSGPSHGTLVINSDGTFRYTPAPGYKGTDSFTYQVCDNGTPSLCATATVTITVNSINHAPVAQDSELTMKENEVLNGESLLSNFSDPDGNNLSINTVPVAGPTHGTLVIHADGTFTYTPDENYFGSDEFTYEVCDDGTPSQCTTAKVTITIERSNMFISQGFSPNGDGINDYFVINGADNYDITLTVFNRWGNKVFESKHYKNDWDGLSNAGLAIGSKLPDGTYFCIIDLNNGEKPKLVYITINR